MPGANPNKGVMIILDGLGDRPIPALGNQTPLEAAHTPQLDWLARHGLCGMSDPLYPGLPVGTHTGTAVLLGVPPGDAARLNRGPVEAAGIGIALQPGDITLRANFATLVKTQRDQRDWLEIRDRRAGRIHQGTDELAALLQNLDLGHQIRASLQAATHHRAVLRLQGPGLSAGITDTDPGDNGILQGVQESLPNESSEAALVTARALNRFIHLAHQKLTQAALNRKREEAGLLPANGIITRGAGRLEPLASLISHYRLRAALISGESTVIGLGRLLGYHIISQPEFTAMPNTNIHAKLDAARQALVSHDIAFVHIKAPDISSHDRNPTEKRDFLERFDRQLQPLIDDGVVILITGDHSTDSIAGAHNGDPVPSLLYSRKGRRDHCTQFGETACMQGGLGRVPAATLLCSMLDAMGAISQYRTSDALLYGFGS